MNLVTSSPSQLKPRIILLSIHIVYCMMVICFGIGVTEFGERLVPGWNGKFIPIYMLAIVFEVLVTRPIRKSQDYFEKILYSIAEWIVLAILVKILLYIFSSPEKFWLDIPLWQARFISFFEGDYLPILLILFLTWIFSISFLKDLEQLDIESQVFFEEPGKLANSRQESRSNIIFRMLSGGIALLIISLLTRADLKQLWGETPASTATMVNVLVYFVLVLISMGLSQYLLMYGKWERDQVLVTSKTSSQWLKYSLIFLGLIGLLAFLLPSRYTIGLLELILAAFNFISLFVITILNILALPFAWLFSLFKSNGPNESPQVSPPFSLPVQAAEITTIPVWELIKSILFWIIFLGVVCYAFVYFFRNNSPLRLRIGQIRLISWVSRLLQQLMEWLAGAQKMFNATVRQQFNKLFSKTPAQSLLPHVKWPNFRSLNPRRQVIFYYLQLIKEAGRSGAQRKNFQTPIQFAENLNQKFHPDGDEIDSLTNLFNEARYSNHEIDLDHTNMAQTLWRKIIRLLRRRGVERPS